jgi:putative glutamine amidotransferase
LRGVAPLFERKAEYPAIAEVNSSHHQAAAKPFPGAIITATAPDGTIEGLAAPQLRLNAVQWHPERLQ